MIKNRLYSTICLLFLCTRVPADFTIGVIPDTQFLVQSEEGAAMVKAMTQFFVDNKNELNLVFVSSLGDMTNNKNNEHEWARVKEAYDLFPQAGIPYAPCEGNHDATPALNEWFPLSDFENTPTWGGHFRGIENAYYLFEAQGMDFILVVTQEPYESEATTWVNSIFEQYPDRRGIFVTHNIPPGEATQDSIVTRHDNLFMAVTGHQCTRERHWTSVSPGGYTQNLILSDYQCDADGGATVRYYTFKPDQDEICARTFNLTTGTYEEDASSEFCFAYDMDLYNVETGPPAYMNLKTSDRALLNDGSTATITATIHDSSGYIIRELSTPIDFTVSPGGAIQGPASVVPENGKATIQVTRHSGTIRVTTSYQNLTNHLQIEGLVNLMKNPSFEIEGTGSHAGATWEIGSGHIRTTDVARTGSASLKAAYHGTQSHITLPVEPGMEYIFMASILHNTGGRAYVEVDDIPLETRLMALPNNANWQTLSSNWVNSENLSEVTIRLVADHGNPLAYFDDVYLLKLEEGIVATAPPKVSRKLNPSAPAIATSASLNLSAYGDVTAVTIYNMSGKKQFDKNLQPGMTSVELLNLDPGYYTLKIATDCCLITRPLVKLR